MATVASRWTVAAALGALAAAVALGLGGCERDNPNECSYWIKRLDNPSRVEEALTQIGSMHCTEAVPKLVQMFDQGQMRDRVLATLRDVGDRKAAAEVFSRAIRIKELSAKAAVMAGDMRLNGARGALEEILRTNRNPSARKPALEALLKIVDDKKELEDLLVSLLEADPAIQGLWVNAKAAEILGEIRSVKAIEPLIVGMFVRTADGREIYQACRLALDQIGPPAVPPLIEAIEGKYKPLLDYVERRHLPKWRWIDGPKLPQVLGDLRDPRAGRPLAVHFAREVVEPQGVSPQAHDEWMKAQTNRLVMGMVAIAQVGSDDSVDPLAAIIPNQPLRETSQRLDAATALALIGSPKALKALFDSYEAEKDYRFRAAMLLPLAMGLDKEHLPVWDGIEKYVQLRKGQKELYFEQQMLLDQLNDKEVGPRLRAYVNTVRECGDRGACYMLKLKDKDLNVRMKAAIMLVRPLTDPSTTFDALLDAFKNSTPPEVDYRRFLIVGMTRHGTAAKAGLVKQFADVLKERGKKEAFWRDEMRVLAWYLERKGK